MSEIEFRDPPPEAKGTPGAWLRRLEPLMGRPGEWAMVKTTPTFATASATAQQLRRGTMRPPPGRWEFRSARAGGDGGEVFARYLGPDEPAQIKAVG